MKNFSTQLLKKNLNSFRDIRFILFFIKCMIRSTFHDEMLLVCLTIYVLSHPTPARRIAGPKTVNTTYYLLELLSQIVPLSKMKNSFHCCSYRTAGKLNQRNAM